MSEHFKAQLDKALTLEITTPCSYHPAGRNSLFLNPLERAEIIKRIEQLDNVRRNLIREGYSESSEGNWVKS